MEIRTTIPQSRYIKIRTVESVENQTERRKMSGLVFTQNERAPFNMVVEMGTADDVRQFFGMDSYEYGFAKVYFAAVGYNGKTPSCIAFTRWIGSREGSMSTSIESQECECDVDKIRDLYDGDLTVTIRTTVGTYSISLDSDSVYGISTLQEFCSVFNTALLSDMLPTWISHGSLAYSNGIFKLKFGEDIDGELLPFGDTPVAIALGFSESQNPVVSLIGQEMDGRVGAIRRIASIYDDFGSFCFIDTSSDRVSWSGLRTGDEFWKKRLSVIRRIDSWLDSEGTRFMFVCGFNRSYWNLLVDSGLSMSTHFVLFDPDFYGYEEAEAMGIFATIDYTSDNEAEYGWMFRENELLSPLGISLTEAKSYSENNINFYGQTQQVGQTRSFYQPGKNADGTDTSVYCSAIWLKDAMQTAIGNRLLNEGKVGLNEYGVGMLGDDLRSVMNEAVRNSTIVVPTELTNIQKLSVNQVFENDTAYIEIQKDGFCISLDIEDGYAKFVLVYHKNGNLRTIEGTHVVV